MSGIVAYLEKTQKAERPPLSRPEHETASSGLFIDAATRQLLGAGLAEKVHEHGWWMLAPISPERASYERRFGTRFHRPQWWEDGDPEFLAEWVDPSAELDWARREELQGDFDSLSK